MWVRALGGDNGSNSEDNGSSDNKSKRLPHLLVVECKERGLGIPSGFLVGATSRSGVPSAEGRATA